MGFCSEDSVRLSGQCEYWIAYLGELLKRLEWVNIREDGGAFSAVSSNGHLNLSAKVSPCNNEVSVSVSVTSNVDTVDKIVDKGGC